MKIEDNAFVNKYINESIEHLKLVYPKLPDKYLRNFVKREVVKNIKDQKCEISNTYTEEKTNASLLSILNYIEVENPIVTGCGSLFMQHSVQIAPANKMLLQFKSNRDGFKIEMFDARDHNNSVLQNNKSIAQKNEKIKMNAFYGAQGQSKSFQYNPACAAATTSQGRSIISTTMWFFESFLMNNIIFDNCDDIIHYINLVNKESVHIELFDWISYIPTKKETINYLMSHYEGDKNKYKTIYAIISIAVNNLSDDIVTKLFYKNNLIFLLNHNEKIRNFIIEKMINNNEDYPNPYKVPKDLQLQFDILMPIIDEFVYMKKYIMYDKVKKYTTHTRKVIIYSDTDSVFIYVGFWVFLFLGYITNSDISKMKMSEIEKNSNFIMKVVNILTNIIYIEIHRTYDTLTSNAHIAEDMRHYINIKNELLMDRIILYDMKKNYIDRIMINEGRILNPPEIEYKGSNLNPKSKNKRVTDRIKEIVSEVALNYDTIDPSLFLWYEYTFRDEIMKSLKEGNIDYLIPIKVKDAESYTNDPDSQYRYKSVQIYIKATNDENIKLPGAFYSIDVTLGPIENAKFIKDNYPDIYENLKNNVYSNPKLSKGGINYISIPIASSSIPKWIIPYIDAEGIVRKHLTPLISFEPSFGINKDNIKQNLYYSTTLSL